MALIAAGHVRLNGVLRRDPETPVDLLRDRIEVDGQSVEAGAKVYLALNKPRGLVTTASDERGRETVFRCLAGSELPFVAPVGRLDQASEGLLLFTNDTAWGAWLTAPTSRVAKVYHVQIDRPAGDVWTRQLVAGIDCEGERLAARRVSRLRGGTRNSWIEVVLDEGRNRHIRRMLNALDVEVLRLVRVAIGPLSLGTLGKGAWRHLKREEVAALSGPPEV